MLEIALNRQPKLACIARLFNALHENALRYCSLKGNERHLKASVSGESDIDVLFDQTQKEALESMLKRLGFKEFVAIRPKRFRDVVDFLAFDPESGLVVHLHSHYQLTLGEPHLKGYQLGIATHVLSTRVFNEDFGIYCIHPAYELLLLYVSEVLKLRKRDYVRMIVKPKPALSEKVLYQHNWLRRQTTASEFEQAYETAFGDDSSVKGLLNSEFTPQILLKMAPVIRKQSSRYRIFSPLHSVLLRWYRELTVTLRRKLSRILTRPILAQRINPRGGIVVALMGTQDRGQSIVTKLLKETFGKKLDVYQAAFHEINTNSEKNFSSGLTSLTGIKEKVTLKHVLTARAKGILVICNGFPECHLYEGDGPGFLNLLSSNNRILRSAAGKETRTLACVPDLAIYFRESDSVKTTADSNKTFNEKCRVVTLPAEGDLTETMHVIKTEIWNLL